MQQTQNHKLASDIVVKNINELYPEYSSESISFVDIQQSDKGEEEYYLTKLQYEKNAYFMQSVEM